jgi:hypothetical protein
MARALHLRGWPDAQEGAERLVKRTRFGARAGTARHRPGSRAGRPLERWVGLARTLLGGVRYRNCMPRSLPAQSGRLTPVAMHGTAGPGRGSL